MSGWLDRNWALALVVLFSTLCLIAGCSGSVSYKSVPKNRGLVAVLPEGATDVEDLGNGWHAFTVEVDGEAVRLLWQEAPGGGVAMTRVR